MTAKPGRAPQELAVGWTFALAPLVLIVATWVSWNPRFDFLIKSFALPILVAQVAIVVLAAVERLRWPRLSPLAASLVILFMFHAWSRAVMAEDRPIAIAFTIFLTIHFLFGMAIASFSRAALLPQRFVIQPFLSAYLAFSALLGIFVVSHYSETRDWVSEIPAFNNIRWFGFYCAAAIGFCAQGWLQGRKALLAVAMIALGLALWTGSRGTFAAISGGYLAVILYKPALASGWRRFFLTLLIGIGIAALLNMLLPLGEQGPQRLLNRDVDSGRLIFWMKAIAAIGQRPWLGWGEAQFNHLIQPDIYSHPHNVILQILLAWGIVGLSLILAAAFLFLRWLRTWIDEASAPFLFAAANLAAFALIDGSLFHLQSLAMFSLSLGMLAGAASAAEARASATISPP